MKSLQMVVTKGADGKWMVLAPWLDEAVVGDTWEEAYWKAVKAS